MKHPSIALPVLFALLSSVAAAQEDGEVTDRIEPPNEEEWAEIQERVPLSAPATPEPTMVFYDVRDLVEAALEPMPSRLEADLDAEEERLAVLGREQSLREETDGLLDLLRAFVEPPLEEGESLSGMSAGGVVVARLRGPQHEWMNAVLHRLRTSVRLHHHVRASFLEGPRGSFREHLSPGTATFLADAPARERFLALAERPEFELLSMPELSVRGIQRGHLAVLNQIPYIAKYELVVVEPGAKEIADPKIEVLNEGYTLDLRVLPLADGQLGLDLALTRAWVERPIPTRKIRLSAAAPAEVEISSPTSHETDVRSRLVLPPDASVVFLTPSNTDERDLAVVLNVRPVLLTGSAR